MSPTWRACRGCLIDKKKCQWQPGGCARCLRVGRPCVAPDGATPRRELLALKRAGRALPAGTAIGNSPVAPPSALAAPQPPAAPPAFTTAALPPPAAQWAAPFAAGDVAPGPFQPAAWPQNAAPLAPVLPPLAASPAASAAPPGLINRCAALFWATYHRLVPLIHRPTFEAALAGRPSPLYGGNRPLALLCAIAATGARAMPASELGGVPRMALVRALLERARDLLLAGYFERAAGGSQIVSDYEAVIASGIVWQLLIPSGMGVKAGSFTTLVIRLAGWCCPRELAASFAADPDSWIRQESFLRVWMGFANLEEGASYYANRAPHIECFQALLLRVPCSDILFNDPDTEAAFAQFCTIPPAHVDLRLLPSGPDVWDDAMRPLVRSLVAPIFSGQASTCTAFYVQAVFRRMRHRLRTFASSAGIDTLAMILRPPAQRTADELTYATAVARFASLHEEAYLSMPPAIGSTLLAGDAAPLFRLWQRYFPAEVDVHMLVQHLMSVRAMVFEHHLPASGSVGGFDPSSAPEFLPVLETAVALSSMYRTLAALDQRGECAHFLSFVPALKAGSVHMAVYAALAPAGADLSALREDVAAVAGYLDLLGASWGGELAGVAANFRAGAQRLGALAPRFVPEEVEVDEDGPGLMVKARLGRYEAVSKEGGGRW
ncbi:hypothetical protein DFJ74DRAFT_741516 [Hyaloraphidium curvatum]|nr:hypothetical protein DFJ74DRAFT_741516 [Hyaloraphidium curvatum]